MSHDHRNKPLNLLGRGEYDRGLQRCCSTGACVFVVVRVGFNMTSSSPYRSYCKPRRVERIITKKIVYVFPKYLHVVRHLRR